jgi:hypothetical protein
MLEHIIESIKFVGGLGGFGRHIRQKSHATRTGNRAHPQLSSPDITKREGNTLNMTGM